LPATFAVLDVRDLAFAEESGGFDALICLCQGGFGLLRGDEDAALVGRFHAALRPGGAFVSYSFMHAQMLPTSWLFRRNLKRIFGRLDIYPVLFNAPPALVYSCVA